MSEEILAKHKERMDKSVESLKGDLQKVRTGKVTPALLDPVRVDAYGTPMPLAQVASVSAPQPRMLVVQPWDKGLLKDVLKAIQKSDLGLNPADDGELIRVPIPALTEDRRKDLAKKAKTLGEDAKISVRNIRRDANDEIKKAEKASELTEDESRRFQGEVQKITDSHIGEIDKILDRKEKEILEV